MTELPNRALLGVNDGNNDGVGVRGAESKSSRAEAAESTLETPLLQGSENGGVGLFRDAEKFGDVCVEFRQTGSCEFGDRCHFLHGTIGDVCVEFRQTGACEFGDRCHFLHV